MPSLIDCPAGISFMLDEEKIRNTKRLYITHHHLDHVAGLLEFLKYNIRTGRRLEVTGPEGITPTMCTMLKGFSESRQKRKKIFDIHELGPEECVTTQYDVKRGVVREYPSSDKGLGWFPLDHNEVPCLAYGLGLGSRKPIVYMTDTKLNEDILEWLSVLPLHRGTLYAECTYPAARSEEAAHKGHLSVREIEEIVRNVECKRVRIINPSNTCVKEVRAEIENLSSRVRMIERK